jgi:hypothetical protein
LEDEVEQVDDEQNDTGRTADLQHSAIGQLAAGVVERRVKGGLEAC